MVRGWAGEEDVPGAEASPPSVHTEYGPEQTPRSSNTSTTV